MKISSFFTDKFDGVKVTPLIENGYFKEICISMQKGAMMKEHRAPSAIVVHVLQGEIEFGIYAHDDESSSDEMSAQIPQNISKDALKKSFVLKAYDFITLEPNVLHWLKANENSIIRLSLGKSDGSARVFRLLRS